MFQQSTHRFTETLQGMKQMAAEMQRELETTRNELRRGILELPQETADSAAQMRRVIVDQIEALAELNRIVARHGRGLDAAEPARRGHRSRRSRAQRPHGGRAAAGGAAALPAAGAATRRHHARRAATEPSGFAVAEPGPGPQGPNGRGWLSELLHRASRPDEAAS